MIGKYVLDDPIRWIRSGEEVYQELALEFIGIKGDVQNPSINCWPTNDLRSGICALETAIKANNWSRHISFIFYYTEFIVYNGIFSVCSVCGWSLQTDVGSYYVDGRYKT
jgi:hypothetical protein